MQNQNRVAAVLLACSYAAFGAARAPAARPRPYAASDLLSNRLETLRKQIPPDAATRTVDTIDALLSLREADAALHVIARGYRRPGDDGGGVFRYDPKAEADENGGTALKPKHLPGRFQRVYDPEGAAYAEWFGAWGDGEHNDTPAINACLAAFGKVRLLAKTYGLRGKPTHYNPKLTYHGIDLGPRYCIEGVGRDKTTVRLLDGTNPPADASYFNVIGNRDFYESADHVIIRDLTIDCNFDGQNKHATIHAVQIRGGGALVERVNFRGYGTGHNPKNRLTRECFVVHQSLVYKTANASRQAATYRDLDFTGCGHNGDVEGHVAEITHITLGGADNFENRSWILPKGHDPDWDPANNGENENNWWPSYGGLVENCTIHDEVYDPATQKSPLHGVTYGNCIGMTVRNNTFTDFEGSCVYVMSWWNRGTQIVDNEFLRVSNGVALQLHGKKGVPVQMPRHEGVRIERNRIVLGAPKHRRWSPSGIQLYGQDMDPTIRFKDIVIRHNHIEGRQCVHADGKPRYPLGITIQVLRANTQNLIVEENVVDVPDIGTSPWIPQQPYSMSIMYFPLARWEQDATSGNVRFINNRTPKGERVYPALMDWYGKNKPRWGKPAG